MNVINLDCLLRLRLVVLVLAVVTITDLILAQETTSVPSKPVPSKSAPDLFADPEFIKAVKEFEAEFSAEGKAVYDKYLAMPPLPDQESRLLGKWHGMAEDADNRSHWRYERKVDGTMMNQMIDVDKVAMEYTRRNERRSWTIRGRVMYEFIKNANDDQEPLTVFLIDAVSEQEIKYQIIFADEAPADWIRDADLAGSGPKIKLGEIYENSEDL